MMWRASVALGPPRVLGSASRRSIKEYIDAMANLFHRAGARRFILGELRGGVLWNIARRLDLAPGKEDLEAVARALGRRDPPGAEALLKAVANADLVLDHEAAPADRRILETAKELTKCL
jgi:hypothetical protein